MICSGAGARRPQSARVCSLVMGRLAEVACRVQRLYQVAVAIYASTAFRITFGWTGEDATDVDLEDYH